MSGMFCCKENLKKMIETCEKYRKHTSVIILIRKKDLESINFNEIPNNIYFIPCPYLKCGDLFILQNEIKDNMWDSIQGSEIEFKRGELNGL